MLYEFSPMDDFLEIELLLHGEVPAWFISRMKYNLERYKPESEDKLKYEEIKDIARVKGALYMGRIYDNMWKQIINDAYDFDKNYVRRVCSGEDRPISKIPDERIEITCVAGAPDLDKILVGK